MAESYSELDRGQLAALLEHLHDKYNNPDFIESDPISVPHTFSLARRPRGGGLSGCDDSVGQPQGDRQERAPHDALYGRCARRFRARSLGCRARPPAKLRAPHIQRRRSYRLRPGHTPYLRALGRHRMLHRVALCRHGRYGARAVGIPSRVLLGSNTAHAARSTSRRSTRVRPASA